MYSFSVQFMTFPSLLILLPPKIPLGPPFGWLTFLGSNNSQISPHRRVKFGRGPTVVSKKGGYRDGHYIVDEDGKKYHERQN